mmetsp:Transcript_10382/g.16938  ORF Transcript_10382/g.16938 Transcript_10382/m.16938 type:complete len:265 (-) Transcript_10382:6-800(-)
MMLAALRQSARITTAARLQRARHALFIPSCALTTYVHPSADVDKSAILDPNTVVKEKAKIHAHVSIGANSVIGAGVVVGEGTIVGYNVSLSNCEVGTNCIIHHGVAVGQDGFGFEVDPTEGEVTKNPQLRRVIIGDNVEIGANTCIDRGSWRDTVIGNQCKIDNLVQIGHNVVLGEGCVICGQVGIAGSVTMGSYVQVGGQAGIAQHVTIGDRVKIAAKSGVTKSLPSDGVYGGVPAAPIDEWRQSVIQLRRMVQKRKQLRHTP